MKFTAEILSGLCNVLKAFVTALSMTEDGNTNLKPIKDNWFDADYTEVLDDSLICHGPEEMGESFVTARWLILKEEEKGQPDLVNDAKILGDHPNIANKKLSPLFSPHSIDWFYDRSLISDEVYNRIQRGIKKIKWRDEVISEVDRVTSEFGEGPLLSIQIRTWKHKWDPAGDWKNKPRDGVVRDYNFETYRDAIDKFLHSDNPPKTIFLTSDTESLLPQYLDYLKDYDVKVITYTQPENVTQMQFSVATMLAASKCDMLVCSRLSTFAECIWWFGGCKADTIPVF
jgi:hypothetical protein